MKSIVIYNSLQEHSIRLDNCKFDAENDDDKEILDELCNQHIESNGFYDVDIWNDSEEGNSDENDFFLIFLDDEEPDWKDNFDDAVEKIKSLVY